MTVQNTLPEDAGSENPEAVVEAFFDQLDTEPDEHVATPTVDDPGGEEVEEDEDEDSDEDSVEPTAEEPADDDVDDEEPEEEELDPLEKRLRDQQSYHAKQMAELQDQLQQMNQWAQQVYQQQLAQTQAQSAAAQQAAQQAPQQAHVTPEQIVQAVDQDIEKAFVWIATNRPDMMPRAISAARANEKYGHEVADDMQHQFNQYQLEQVRAQAEAVEQARLADIQAAQRPAETQAVMQSMIEGIKSQYGPAFDAIEDEFVARAQETAPSFAQYIADQGLEMTNDAIHYFLTKTVNDIREEKVTEQSGKPRRARKLKSTEHVETSSTGVAPEDMTADDLAMNDLLEGAKSLSIDIAPTR